MTLSEKFAPLTIRLGALLYVLWILVVLPCMLLLLDPYLAVKHLFQQWWLSICHLWQQLDEGVTLMIRGQAYQDELEAYEAVQLKAQEEFVERMKVVAAHFEQSLEKSLRPDE